jgi:hypothetical protein
MERPDDLPRATINHGDQDPMTYYPEAVACHDGHVVLIFESWKMDVPWSRVKSVCQSIGEPRADLDKVGRGVRSE